MNRLILFTMLFLTVVLTSCDLDIVPDDIPTVEDHAFSLRKEAEKVLFTCHSFMPKDGNTSSNPALVGAGDYAVTTYYRGNAPSWYIALGLQKSDGPYCNKWGDLYKAIAYCNIFLENIHKTPDMTQEEKDRWIAEAIFLKAYYHFYLVRMYGPITIMDEYISIDADSNTMQKHRNTIDECFDYIIGLLDHIIEDAHLPEKIDDEINEMGRPTIGIAKALKAKVLLTAASPLFNGNTDYIGYTDNRGIEIFNPNKTNEEKMERWEAAALACKEAIDFLEGMGHKLYNFPAYTVPTMIASDSIMMNIRGAVTEKWNTEIIWANSQSWTSGSGLQNVQLQSLPRDLNKDYASGNTTQRNNLGVSLKITNEFYTKNGVPINEDKEWDYENRMKVQTVSGDVNDNTLIANYETAGINIDREYRYYASLAFDGNIWFGQGKTTSSELHKVLVVGGHIMLTPADHSQNLTGMWSKKLVNYKSATSATGYSGEGYPFPIIRLADLYLMYAEALNECGKPYVEVIRWIDPIRERAGLKGVKEAWEQYSNNPNKFETQSGMREIIMQERRIELAFEGHYFWDVRRWKTAVKELSKPITGWNAKEAGSPATFYQEKSLYQYDFSPRDYFWPFPLTEIRRNPNLLQNYGW